MKALQCELCGSTDIIKDGDFFVCQSCGMKYTLETAKKMMVEGVVQVEGTVKTDRTEDADRYLALARTAQNAGNNADAEKYASMALEIDLKNAEAWSIKAKAIDWQLTFDNDRLSESNAACISMLKLLNRAPSDFEEINAALNIAIGFIEHLRAIANSEADFFCQKLANLPNAKNLELIQSGLISHLQSRELQWKNIEAVCELQTAAVKRLSKEPGESAEIPENIEELLDTFTEDLSGLAARNISSMYYNAAITILTSAVNGSSAWSERWNKVRVFDYYATDDFDCDNEEEAFHLCIDAYDSCIQATRLAIDLFDSKVAKQGTTTDEMLLKCWGILCTLEELCIKVRTNRRYYGYYGHSSEQITNDGFFLSDEAKQLRREQLEKDMAKRDEYDPEKKRERERAEKEAELKANYWLNNPAKKEQKQAFEDEFDRLGNELRELKSRRSFFSPFEFKAKRECDAKIEQARERRREIKDSLQALDDELMAYVSNEIEA